MGICVRQLQLIHLPNADQSVGLLNAWDKTNRSSYVLIALYKNIVRACVC